MRQSAGHAAASQQELAGVQEARACIGALFEGEDRLPRLWRKVREPIGANG